VRKRTVDGSTVGSALIRGAVDRVLRPIDGEPFGDGLGSTDLWDLTYVPLVRYLISLYEGE